MSFVKKSQLFKKKKKKIENQVAEDPQKYILKVNFRF